MFAAGIDDVIAHAKTLELKQPLRGEAMVKPHLERPEKGPLLGGSSQLVPS